MGWNVKDMSLGDLYMRGAELAKAMKIDVKKSTEYQTLLKTFYEDKPDPYLEWFMSDDIPEVKLCQAYDEYFETDTPIEHILGKYVPKYAKDLDRLGLPVPIPIPKKAKKEKEVPRKRLSKRPIGDKQYYHFKYKIFDLTTNKVTHTGGTTIKFTIDLTAKVRAIRAATRILRHKPVLKGSGITVKEDHAYIEKA